MCLSTQLLQTGISPIGQKKDLERPRVTHTHTHTFDPGLRGLESMVIALSTVFRDGGPRTYLLELLWGLNKIIYVKSLQQ